MNFIELKSKNGRAVLINFSTVTCIVQDSNGMATVCFDSDEHIDLNERYEDLVNIIESVQRRNGNG